ncbi:Growth hormone-inducible transmembrane protein [Fulvia fulva]|uniref:Growth hormone-inducible transmembrane protein n=1 Tax=Passalora fulva TaxID=5499 RepID=A0A9Q8P7F1_PASFU|nr:Growth hormone-inducible transmembrane protein [Fulvia fulva]KAK4626693.1 Growth hormone-inducible transmembrane protein [Fulvia fulva]KAK4628436.1 Growth hormone-inducible transmembrane protein [Fulvia fulva]UJO15988.1 Growth hormone-inducible transmembrane protein [Fulvia fulva]WPV13131.1 Growth hormone-inducible transmembrane protein [Fulvia fulva]WPV28766.1 Growth hormone-inducible transmembrane protein [Fulvia fulva]
MAFLMRRPFAVTSTLARELQQSAPRTVFRSFQTSTQQPIKQNAFKQIAPITKQQSVFRNAFQQSRRGYQTQTPQTPLAQGNLTQRLVYGGAIFGGTLLAVHLIFNRETREDGGMPPYERSYLNETFLHTGLGIGIIGIAARALHTNGWSYRLMSANPWLVLGIGLVGSIGTMMGCHATPPENYVLKYGLWAGFNVTQAALLSPLLFFSPAILARAALYTVGLMGSIAFVGATAKTDKYLYIGGPLLAGVAIVALSGLAPLVLPATAARTLMWTENIWLYGGLAVFGGFTLYDTQKILAHARMAERGQFKRDAVNESIALELDFINIFVRMVQIMGMSQRRK